MRFSKSYIKTLKETPKEAEVISHKLMLRAAMIKKLASGVYTYLPLGFKAMKKVENIVREEMNRAGSQEIFMPVLHPSELWKESGRWEKMGEEMFKLYDRHDREFALGPTHEEVVTDLIRNDLTSHKVLPMSLYQIQTKFRDERRPRFGLMRCREFIMKDAYSFHTDQESLNDEFLNMRATYERIFTRCGLKFRPVEADSGAIGGSGSQEFHVLAESGEDEILFCDKCTYASNTESATSKMHKCECTPEMKEPELVATPGMHTIEGVVEFLGIDIETTVKSMTYKDVVTDDVYLVLIRGDYEINEVKLKNLLNTIDVVLLSEEEIEKYEFRKGSIGPYKPNFNNVKIIADISVPEIINQSVGGNVDGYHYINVNYGRDYTADIVADIRKSKVGDTCPRCDGKLHSARGIETGHIFKLGDKYSSALGATYLDEKGISHNILMGCYGIGIDRTLAAAIEQNYDENGIIWPCAIAPYIVDVIPTNTKDEAQMSLAEEIYKDLQDANIDVMIDDRDAKAGFKFKDADLIGFPFKVVCGKRAAEGVVELKIRRTGEVIEIDKKNLIAKIQELMIKF